jgi:hypothetical protein
MGPDLSRRLGRALGTHVVSLLERDTVTSVDADGWDDLPADVQTLVTEIEARPGPLEGSPTDLLAREYTRDKDGKFATTGGRARGEDLLAAGGTQLAEDLARDSFGDSAAMQSTDSMLHQIAQRQSFDGKPTVVSREEMDAHIAGGDTEMFRGIAGHYIDERGDVSAAELNDQFRTGDAFFGVGGYGNGIYASNDRATAENDYSDRSPGSVARMALSRDARTIDHADLEAEHARYLRDKDPDSNEARVFGDLGRYAAARGYDAVEIKGASPHDAGENWFIVLNRTALVVEEA